MASGSPARSVQRPVAAAGLARDALEHGPVLVGRELLAHAIVAAQMRHRHWPNARSPRLRRHFDAIHARCRGLHAHAVAAIIASRRLNTHRARDSPLSAVAVTSTCAAGTGWKVSSSTCASSLRGALVFGNTVRSAAATPRRRRRGQAHAASAARTARAAGLPAAGASASARWSPWPAARWRRDHSAASPAADRRDLRGLRFEQHHRAGSQTAHGLEVRERRQVGPLRLILTGSASS